MTRIARAVAILAPVLAILCACPFDDALRESGGGSQLVATAVNATEIEDAVRRLYAACGSAMPNAS